jgi:hypothetical protein
LLPSSPTRLIALAIVAFALFSGGNLSSGVREDRANRWVIVAFGLIGLLDAYLPAYTDRKEFWTLDGDAVRWLATPCSRAFRMTRRRHRANTAVAS